MKVQHLVGLIAVAAAFVSGCNDTQLTNGAVAGDAPTAIITGNQAYGPLDTANFDGSTSYAVSPKTIASYSWSITQRPSGSAAQVTDNGSTASFFVDLAGDYKIKLRVTDSNGVSGETEYPFSAVPSQDFHIEATWEAQYGLADMDLHLVDKTANASLWDPMYDCDFIDCKVFTPGDPGLLDWGASGVTNDNPTLDIDNITEHVPENINIKNPANGTYQVVVHYYGDHGAGAAGVDVTLHIYLNGQEKYTHTFHFSSVNQIFTYANVAFNNGQGTVTPVEQSGTTIPM